ncbi:MAG TPA: barstar family protein [Burkholderiales bacterium]|nr:barstar family protein [Burkholderiales bacterium]
MSKLLQRLSDASKSGVYRASRSDQILDACRGSGLGIHRVQLEGVAGRDALMDRFAGALALPGWFGRNWDALEDCLCDLSWTAADGHVLLIEGSGGLPADERGILLEVLGAAAAYWAGRGRSFFAVLVDGPPELRALYREGP